MLGRRRGARSTTQALRGTRPARLLASKRPALGIGQVADRADAIISNSNICSTSGRSSAIEHLAIFEHEVERHGASVTCRFLD
jgi:hypothetical protein